MSAATRYPRDGVEPTFQVRRVAVDGLSGFSGEAQDSPKHRQGVAQTVTQTIRCPGFVQEAAQTSVVRFELRQAGDRCFRLCHVRSFSAGSREDSV
ncbi:hypothetical protein ACU4GR_14770 [Methylobacterium oryzae CBMB20]